MAIARLVRVLLVDDHTMVRQGLRSILQTYPNLEVVGEASTGEEAVDGAGKLRPAVVVMDIAMPKMDGIAATRLIKTNFPHIAVLGLSVNTQGYHVDAMLKAGAFEVLTKEKAVNELYGAIQRAVASTQPILVLEDEPASTESPGDAKESADPRPNNELPVKDKKT